jgi:hypothetical protein
VFREPVNNEHLGGGLVWDSDRPLLRYLEGGTVHTLELAGSVTSAWRDNALDVVLLSPDGRMLATAEHSGTGYRSSSCATPATGICRRHCRLCPCLSRPTPTSRSSHGAPWP